MSKLLYSIDPGFVVELLTDHGDGTALARVVEIAEWEHWVERGTEMTIPLSAYAEQPQ